MFKLTPGQRARLARVHQRGEDGTLAPIDFELPQEPEFEMGGGGLYSTVPDYMRFARMLLSGGTWDGAQVLRGETVDLMFQNHIGTVSVAPMKTANPALSNDADFFPGMVQNWGISFVINTEKAPTGRAAGSVGWAGLANSYYQAVPRFRDGSVPVDRLIVAGVRDTVAVPEGPAPKRSPVRYRRAEQASAICEHGQPGHRSPSK